MVLEQGGDHPTQWASISSVAGKIGCSGETLRNWVRQASFKELMIGEASEIFVLADADKFGRATSQAWTPLDRPWTLITYTRAIDPVRGLMRQARCENIDLPGMSSSARRMLPLSDSVMNRLWPSGPP